MTIEVETRNNVSVRFTCDYYGCTSSILYHGQNVEEVCTLACRYGWVLGPQKDFCSDHCVTLHSLEYRSVQNHGVEFTGLVDAIQREAIFVLMAWVKCRKEMPYCGCDMCICAWVKYRADIAAPDKSYPSPPICHRGHPLP